MATGPNQEIQSPARDVTQEVKQKVDGLITDSFSLHVKVSLSKILNPRLLLMAVPHVNVCVCVSDEHVGTLYGRPLH